MKKWSELTEREINHNKKKHCEKCLYFSRGGDTNTTGSRFCEYLLITGHSRGSDVASKIRSFLHFSVPDEGPLTDYESWMPDFVSGLAEGIEKSRGMIQKAVQGLSGDLVVSANVTGIQTAGTTNVNFYGNYKFEDKQDIDYFMNQAALRISRKR